jgi:hypothetical protein
VTTGSIEGHYREAKTLLAFAALCQRRLPRGKGALPRWIGARTAKRKYYIRTRHGAKLAMEPGSWDVYATMRLNGGAWDYHDFGVCLAGMSGSHVFYDVGANVGYYSIEMAAKLGPSAKIIAFEPQPDLAQAIATSARLNGMDNINVINAAVGDSTREAQLFGSVSLR